MKNMLIFASAACIVVMVGSLAFAQSAQCPKGGRCPAGTCAQDGGILACNVANCSAKNCAGKGTSNTGSRAQCCSAWYGRCVSQGYPAANCASLRSGCNSSGVFAFRTGTQPRC